MVAVLDLAICSSTRRRKILIANAKYRLAHRQRRGLDDGHGIGHHITTIGAVRAHNGGGGHDPLEISLGIDDQEDILHPPGLAVAIHRDKAQQLAHRGRIQTGNINGGLLGIFAAGNANAIAYIPDHADGLIVAVAHDDAGFQAVGQRLIQDLPHIAIQPFGAKVQHGLADGQERGQLQKAGIHFPKAGQKFLYDFIA